MHSESMPIIYAKTNKKLQNSEHCTHLREQTFRTKLGESALSYVILVMYRHAVNQFFLLASFTGRLMCRSFHDFVF